MAESVAEELRRLVEERVRQAGQAGLQAVVDVGLQIWHDANQTAPKRTGDLRASAYLAVDGVEQASGEQPPQSMRAPIWGGALRHVVEFGYGVHYAIYVHELGEKQKEFKHPSTPGTRPKWLELTLQENRDRYQRYIEQKVQEALNDAG
ncbi:MAG TPA: hypothetical protein VIK99_05935 [Thermaerobacter sp.]